MLQLDLEFESGVGCLGGGMEMRRLTADVPFFFHKCPPDSTLLLGFYFYFQTASQKSSPGRVLICCVDQVGHELRIMFLLPSV